MDISFIFNWMTDKKKVWPNKQEMDIGTQLKRNKKSKLKFFSKILCFCLYPKLWFILFGLRMRKLWTILVFGQSKHLQKKLFVQLWMLISFNPQSNLMKFLLHDLRQVKYKIRQLDSNSFFISWSECSRSGNFEWFLT